MTSLPEPDRAVAGLRERKKARTKAAIQQEALRLFREQGYEATTIEQIAEAAEFSPSTFFRYFPTKEDVVLYDALDPMVIAAFEAQRPELSPVQALREAARTVFAEMPPEELQDLQERIALILAVPEVRARMLDEFIRTIRMLTELLARRVGRPVDDFDIRVFAGALIGVVMSVALAAMDDPSADFLALMDTGLARLEAGLRL